MSTGPRRRRNLTLAACCAVHGVQDGLAAALYVILPVLAQALGLGYAQVGLVRAVNNSAMALLEIPSGVLAERFGERNLLVFGAGCAGIGYLALSTSTRIEAIVLSLFVAGFGAAFQHALSSSIVSTTFAGSGPRAALGTYNASGDVGKLVFTGLFSAAIGMGAAWRGVVAGYGAAALIVAVVLLVVLRRLRVGERPRADAGVEGEHPGRKGWGIRDRGGFAVLAAIVFLDIAVQSGFLTFLAFLMLEKQVPTGLAALAVTLTLGGGMLGKFACGHLAERLGVRRSLVVVECLTAAGIVAVLLAPTLVAYFLLPVLGIVLQGSSSITYATVGDLVESDRRSRGFAAIYSIASGASIAGPVVFGLIGDRFGLAPAMLCMALVVLVPVPLSAWLRAVPAGAPGVTRSHVAGDPR